MTIDNEEKPQFWTNRNILCVFACIGLFMAQLASPVGFLLHAHVVQIRFTGVLLAVVCGIPYLTLQWQTESRKETTSSSQFSSTVETRYGAGNAPSYGYMSVKESIVLASCYFLGLLIMACDKDLNALTGFDRYAFSAAGFFVQIVPGGTIGVMSWRRANASARRRQKQEQAEIEAAERQIQELLAARNTGGSTS